VFASLTVILSKVGIAGVESTLDTAIRTGLSWLCFYRALLEGPASVVIPIDNLSILVTVGWSFDDCN